MARKDPFRAIMVARKIIDALEPIRQKESLGQFRPMPMNTFCEQLLWDYAEGKIGYLGKDAIDSMNAMGRGELKLPEDPVWGTSVHEVSPDPPAPYNPLKHSKKKPRKRKAFNGNKEP